VAVTLILHAYRWPSRADLDAIVADVRTATGEVATIVEARENEASPAGAAAAINHAAASASGLLIVAEPSIRWSASTLSQLFQIAGEQRALTIASGPVEGAPNGGAGVPAGGRKDDRCRLWAIDRATFDRLGKLDERFWSIGEVDDVIARAHRAGVETRIVAAAGRWIGPEAYPLAPVVREFLQRRNPLITAFRTWPIDRLAPWIALRAATALLESAHLSDARPEAFAFGARSQDGASADGAATGEAILPLLAIDSFLSMVPSLVEERAAQHTVGADPCVRPTPDPCVRREAFQSVIDSLAALLADEAPGPGANDGQRAARPTSADTPSAAPLESTVDAPLPRVSVIVVNWNGREHLETCWQSIEASTYPADRLELILIDNGSSDGSRELMASRFPRVRVVALPENRGFTGGNQAGVAAATGDVFVFLNNDMRVEPTAIRALVDNMDAATPCTSARVLSWDGRRIDFIGGGINFEARGFQHHFGKPIRPEYNANTRTFFPNGGAFAISRTAYDAAGGFDPAFFAYYDDVDLGWRVWLTGGAVRVVPEAVVYHVHGATSGRYPSRQKQYHMHRNSLWSALQNYGDLTLRRVLGTILLLLARRVVQQLRINRRTRFAQLLAPFSARCRGGLLPRRPLAARDLYGEGPVDLHQRVASHVALEVLAAVSGGLRDLPRVASARQAIQQRRVVSDATLLPAAGFALHASTFLTSYLEAQTALVKVFGLDRLFGGRPRLLIVTHEPLRPNMSGPGVRVLEIGRALGDECDVTIATPYAPEIEDPVCRLAAYSYDRTASLRTLAEQADTILVQGFTLSQFPFLTALDLPIIADLYCPFTLEHLEMKAGAPGVDTTSQAGLSAESRQILDVQNAQLAVGDFFICASERQRDFWIGALHTAGRINPLTYARDRNLRQLIDVVPFGLPDRPLAETVERAIPALKGTHPAIAATDRVLLWGGSLLDWQDPETLIRAVGRLAATRSDVKLFFMGVRHPNPQVAPMRVVDESRTLARELGLLDTHVVFNDWVPYAERGRYLGDSDLGVSTHREHLETRYSFRTRMLDYIWAGLPIVCTRGDFFADLVEDRQLGLTVPPGDVDALAAALARLLDDAVLRQRCVANLEALRPELHWRRVVQPLRDFCRAPHFAADRAVGMSKLRTRLEGSFRLTKWAKQTALRLGLEEQTLEQVKRWKVVESAMVLRNRIARARALR